MHNLSEHFFFIFFTCGNCDFLKSFDEKSTTIKLFSKNAAEKPPEPIISGGSITRRASSVVSCRLMINYCKKRSG